MDEVDELISEVLDTSPAERITYARAFRNRLGMDPHRATLEDLQEAAGSEGLDHVQDLDRDGWLQLLMSHLVEPRLGHDRPVFLLDYPASQAALAKIRHDEPPVAERFELFFQGLELANGYHELTDPEEHRRRFHADLAKRQELGLPAIPVDERFLKALEDGLPPCAGVALGVDRLVLIAAGGKDLGEVLAFPFDRL
jgi:lysyl-tRNA synthetase class 2